MGALNIKDGKVAEKARRLARLKGKNITAAVSEALDESLGRELKRKAADRDAREKQVDEIVARFRARLGRGAPSPWKVMRDMYDESGRPR